MSTYSSRIVSLFISTFFALSLFALSSQSAYADSAGGSTTALSLETAATSENPHTSSPRVDSSTNTNTNVNATGIVQSIANAEIGTTAVRVYSGQAYKPEPAVKINGKKLKAGADFTYSYRNNVKAGTATIVVKGKGNYSGYAKQTFRIYKKSIANASIDYPGTMTYSGNAFYPKPKVHLGSRTLKAGTDFTYSYRDNVNAGTAKIIVTGKGNYKGATSTTFEIVNPQPVYSGGGDTVYITYTGSKYHEDGCRHLSRSKIPISRGEAESQGYEPCKVCRP